MNPRLVFTTEDINYWFTKKLDESRLTLEFAARKLILEQADEQRVVISDRKMLDEAAQQVMPLLQKPPVDPLSDGLRCAGDTSDAFVKQSWDALTSKDYEKAFICTNNAINKWTRQADTQQLKATNNACADTPQPAELKSYYATNWALSDIATAWFIRGEAFRQQAKWAQARQAYKTVIDKYHCAFAWDARGWFWRTADTAQEKYDEIRLK
ncbi:MAG TPA: hypothetical protein VJU86_01985 [Pyrinomonadaceae bacterium]|nr:hypothetical protein [Pyrinomonadaceae bacterium]